MSITIHIQLLSGDVIPLTGRAVRGTIKYETMKKRIHLAVLAHLGLTEDTHRVSLMHEDDDARLQEQWTAHVNKWWSRRGQVPTAEDYDFASHSQLQPELYTQMKGYVDKERRYTDGSVVHALVEEFNIRQLWDELKDD